MVKWLTIILAVVGLAAGIYTVATAKQELPRQPPAPPPSINPYPRGIAALGVVEPAGREVMIAAPEQGMVTSVDVRPGDHVEAGAILFRLDARVLESQRVEAEAALELAKAQLERLEHAPRAEDVPPLEAALAQAQARVGDAQDLLERAQSALAEGGANQSEVDRRQWQLREAQASRAAAQADLERLKAGTWRADLEVARAQVSQASARIAAVNELIDRLVVRAPAAGDILKRNIEPGEFAMASPMQMTQAAIIMGNLSTLNVRARVDEEDAPLLRAGARATARVRGVSSRELPLRMLRIEALALPKVDIFGTPTERIDTRVVEVVFQVDAPRTEASGESLYPGQALDVFIEASLRTEPQTQ